MKYSDVAAGSSEGVRQVMEFLSSCPPELTAKELKEHLIKEILFTDYPKKRSNTHWRTRVLSLLTCTPDLPEELIRKGVNKIRKGFLESHVVDWTGRIYFIPDLPVDLKAELLAQNHQQSSVPPKVKKVLNEILPVWLAMPWEASGFNQEDGVFFFASTDRWEILDRSKQGVLLYVRIGETMVVLLPDVSGKGQGCAVEVDPSAKIKTVHQAIAWMYQQNPDKWKGFDREV